MSVGLSGYSIRLAYVKNRVAVYESLPLFAKSGNVA